MVVNANGLFYIVKNETCDKMPLKCISPPLPLEKAEHATVKTYVYI